MKTLKILGCLVLVAVIGMFYSSCKKDQNVTTPVKVRLTDAPGNFQQVNVEILGVEFKINKDTEVNLNINQGIYNLLDYTNGLDTLIAYADVPSGKLSQIRLILGTNNTVMVDSVIYPLSTPSAMQSGLKLQVKTVLEPGVLYDILLDFDANQSIGLSGDGKYHLKPVIRTINEAISGSVSGSISNLDALPATITATDGVSTYSTITTKQQFLLIGIPEGTYTITATPQTPFQVVTLSDVKIKTGEMLNLGTIQF